MTTERTHDDASQHVPEVGNRPGVGGWMRQIGWGALALFLAAFAVFESVKYGLPTTAAMLGFFALPDLARLAGVRPPGPLYQVVHRVWVPLAIVVGYSLGPVAWPPLFTAGLGWLTRIAVERAFGRGLSQSGTS
ncbi:DUF4260 family protein [Nonomuraea sp. NEAU-A123]|uniref:DUF4260 family protein n=1 Tax=Nonomuraea sp. NEAU-A123 TaxID=2839649 RepID=UPI001BE48786|nr:DUF4260 family protein [Nonomuraea sp. NEAU-A123]MBT2233054.1 DUF4260 family protein [Nonomuraea sp. NEAU-A123]